MSKHINSFSGKNDKGFTLVEILVSLMLLLILVIAFVPLFTYVSQAIASNKARDVAVEIATQKMEEMRALPYIVMTEGLSIDTTKPQLGLKDGDPPGSIEPTQTITVNNRTYTINTDIAWGDNEKSFKIVSVSVESPGVFNEAVKIINRFDTMAAQEGVRVEPGSILVEVYNSKGEPLDESIQITIETSDLDETDYTIDGKALFTNLPSGAFEVKALVPANMVCHPDLTPQYDGSTRLITEHNVTVTYNKQAKVSFTMDRPAGINFYIKDQANNNISTNNNFVKNEFVFNWYESDPSHTMNITTRSVTNNELNNGKLDNAITNLWPEGTYIVSFRIDKKISDSDFRLYNAYYNDNIKLTAGTTKNITVNVDSPPIKVALLAKDSWVESRDAPWITYKARKWFDRSGNGYNAENTVNNDNLQPRWRKSDNTMVFESNAKQYLAIKSEAECKNNFTVFVSANPDEDHGLDAISNDPSNTLGTSGQKYLFYPSQKGDQAGMGISLGKNGVTVYEHGNNYMPAKARFDANLNRYSIIAVRYYHDPAGVVNPTPSIYVNGEHKTTGYPSNRTEVYSPLKIGGDLEVEGQQVWGYYRGNLRAVLIYDSPALDDFNIKAVSQYLYDNYR